MNKIYTYVYYFNGNFDETRIDIELPAVNSSGYEYIAQKCAEDLCVRYLAHHVDDHNIELDLYDGYVYINTFTIKITHPPVCTVISSLSDEEK